MIPFRAGTISWSIMVVLFAAGNGAAQCPMFPTSSITGNSAPLCEGSAVTLSVTGVNLNSGSAVEWYLDTENPFDPYNGEGTLIGSVPVMTEPCNDPPEVLYIMVNPDNIQAGGPGDQCDEFMVLWTGSGGFNTSDIMVTNLGPGTFQWNSFVAGNASTFTCGTPLPPGPVPANAILIIQSNTMNNVMVNSDVLCASGLPVYIIAYDGTTSCVGGYFDNTAPCASCPVMIDINGVTCQYSIDLDYQPPSSAVNGWGWANTGSGVYANVIPPVTIPVPTPAMVTIADFIWIVPANFCEMFGGGPYFITGVLDPPPSAGCPLITTSFFSLTIVCPGMTLSGGGDVCEGNCPEDPTEITFTLTGGDTPFEADLLVMASLFPPFMIDNLQISNGQTISVCLEGFLPSFDPGTGVLNIPELAIGLSATVQVVSLVSASGCPVEINPNSVTLHFIEAASVNTGPDQTICSNESVTVTGTLGGSANTSFWTTNGDGNFDDPESLTTIYTPGPGDITNGQVTLTLSGTDENGVCIPAESSMTVTILPSLLIDVNSPLTICDNDVANVVAVVTGSSEPCNWETSGDGSFDDPFAESTVYTPGPDDISNGMVTLTYIPVDPDACVEANEPLVLTIVPAPEVVIPQNLEVCIGDSIVVEIDIDGAFTNVTWSTSGDGDLVIESVTEVTYTPGPMDIQDQFVVLSVSIQSAFPECGIATYNMPVNIIDCDCPPLDLDPPSGPLCALNASLDLQDLLIEGGSGTWSMANTPPGGNPATISGTVFTANNSDPGIYTVTYTLTFPEPGCPPSASLDIALSAPAVSFAGMDMAFCGPQAINAVGMIIPASGLPTAWESSGDGVFQDPESLSTVYIPGSLDSLASGLYLILHVMDGVCGVQSDTVTFYFNTPPLIQFSEDTIEVCNTAAFGSVVDFWSLLSVGDTTGTWRNISGVPVDFSSPDSVDFDGITAGLYPFEYMTQSAASPCAEAVDTIVISVGDCLCPLLQVQNLPGGICNNLPPVNMDAFIMAGAPGSWQIISAPPGSNPATLAGSVLTLNGCDQGDYALRFTFDSAPIPGCPDSAEVTVFIQDQPTIVITGDTATCGQDDVQVSALLGGSATGITWMTTGSGTFADPGVMSTLYTPSIFDVASAHTFLFAITTDTFGFCMAASDTIHVFIPTPPSTTFSMLTDTLCLHPDSNSIINLAGLIIEGDGTGFWSDADGAMVDLTDLSQVGFDGVPPGVYRLIYTTQTALAPCMETMYAFTVVVEDCACPDLMLSPSDVRQCLGDSLDLNTLILQADPGAWSVTQGPGGTWPVIAGNQLTSIGAAAGSYTITYTLDEIKPGCPGSADISLVLESPPSVSVSDMGCDSTQTTYEVIVLSDASSVTSDFGNVTTAGAGAFRIADVPAGQDILLLLSSASGICSRTFGITAPDCDCTLFTEDIADTLTFCPGDTFVLIPIVTGAQGLPFATWITPDGVKMRPTLPLFMPGQYIWIVRDSIGCEERDTFYAAFIGPEILQVTTSPPSCAGMSDGSITIQSIGGGSPPFTVMLDNGSSHLVSQLPYIIDQIGVGDYVLTVMDMMGCTLDTTVTIDDANALDIDLGPDLTIAKGDSVLISPKLNGIEVTSFAWDPVLPGQAVIDFWYSPEVTTLLSLSVTDSSGCIYEDQVLITVYEVARIYAPNVFSPNGDQINDLFEIFTNLPPEQLVSLEIFDRWGSLLYGQYEGSPLRWDGNSGSKEALSGVYVYKLTWKDENGLSRIQTGDVTLIR